MTLDTRVWVHGPIHGRDLFKLALKSILHAADRLDEVHTVELVEREGSIHTRIGQGLPAIVEVSFNEDGSPLALEDTYDDEEPEWVVQRKCQAQLSWDTGYGYHDERCATAAVLHSFALATLAQLLPEGVTLSWENEFDGTIHQGVNTDDLTAFCGSGIEAVTWFETVAKPAIEAEHQKEVPWR